MNRNSRSPFWDLICAFSNAVYILFTAGFVLLALTALSIVFRDALDTAGQLMVMVNSVLVTTLLLTTGYVLYRCNRD